MSEAEVVVTRGADVARRRADKHQEMFSVLVNHSVSVKRNVVVSVRSLAPRETVDASLVVLLVSYYEFAK